MTTEFMIDIETLDTKPTSVVLSAGVVVFDQERGPIDKFYTTFDGQEQIDAGRTISMDTILFWMQQSDEARAAAFIRHTENDDPFGTDGIDDFVQWIYRHKSPEGATFWANSPSFDMVILESCIDDMYANGEYPWAFRGFRDCRTLLDQVDMGDFKPEVTWKEPDHHPLGDCYWQIENVREARRRLKIPS